MRLAAGGAEAGKALPWCALAIAAFFQIATAAAETIPLRIAKATPGFDERTTQPIITLELTASSRRTFGELTSQNIGRVMEIRVDGKTLMSPVIREAITGGQVQVSGQFTVQEVSDIAGRLNAGTAKVEMEVMPQ
jgi:preprotein translocase subunit SecD